MTPISPLWRNIGLLCVLNWAWILLSASTTLTPVNAVNEYAQTVARWTTPAQVPTSGDEATRYAVALEVAAGRGFVVPPGLADTPATMHLPPPTSGGTERLVPRFTPLYGLLLGGLTKLTAAATNGGAIDDQLNALTVYRVLVMVPALVAATLLCWGLGLAFELRGLRDKRWWYLAVPVTLLSPLALRETILSEHALAAALCWTGLTHLNTALFRIGKEQPWQRWAWFAGACLMLAAGITPLAFAALTGFGGVLLAEKQPELRKLGINVVIGAAPILLIVILSHMWGFNKLLPLLSLSRVDLPGAVRYVLTDLAGLNGLLWMFPLSALGVVVLVSRILRTQELEDAQKVDRFRAGQGAFHWGAYWTLLAAVGLAVVDAAFFYGLPQWAPGNDFHLMVPWLGEKIPISYYRYAFGGDSWVVFLPLTSYYCAFIFREPVLLNWGPWYHNLVRVGALVWFFGAAQPVGGLVCPFVEAVYKWGLGMATYYPMGRIQ